MPVKDAFNATANLGDAPEPQQAGAKRKRSAIIFVGACLVITDLCTASSTGTQPDHARRAMRDQMHGRRQADRRLGQHGVGGVVLRNPHHLRNRGLSAEQDISRSFGIFENAARRERKHHGLWGWSGGARMCQPWSLSPRKADAARNANRQEKRNADYCMYIFGRRRLDSIHLKVDYFVFMLANTQEIQLVRKKIIRIRVDKEPLMTQLTKAIREPKDLLDLVASEGQTFEAAKAESFKAKVGLGPTGNGYATLFWGTTGATPGKYDFVALYASASEPDGNYLTNQWQWVNGKNEGSYQTGTGISNGQNARYVTWNGSAYVSIANIGTYNGTQWSS